MKNKKLILVLVLTLVFMLLVGTEPTLSGSLESSLGGLHGAHLQGMLPSKITYQGRLTDAAGNPLTGAYDMTFQLWDDAQVGNPVGSPSTQSGVKVTEGVFTVKVEVPTDAFNGQSLWLEVKVSGQTLGPRQELLAVPYALGLRPGASITSSGIDTLHVGNQSGGFAVEAWSRNNIALVGTSGSVSSGPPSGLHGVHGVGEGVGVYGAGGHTGVHGTGSNDGVWGVSIDGYGARGTSTNKAGLKGESTNANGVVGWSGQSGPGEWSGVYGHSADAVGVTGKSKTYNGIKAITFSDEHAALAAGNEAAGPAIYAKGGTDGLSAIFAGNVQVRSLTSGATLIELGEGLDYAEGFDVSAQVTPGTVLVIDPNQPGELTVSQEAYDRKVAGIVSGAQGLGSAVKVGAAQFDTIVALAGRVYCNVDGSFGAIEPGDLLTTSPTPGYAMVVKDYPQAQGAILGKAMEALPEGEQGQILVLVSLQ